MCAVHCDCHLAFSERGVLTARRSLLVLTGLKSWNILRGVVIAKLQRSYGCEGEIHHLFRGFRGLRWRLTLSYTLVTLLPILALEATLATIGILLLWRYGSEELSENIIRIVSGVLVSAAVLTLVFGLLGTLFGYAWTRWLTGRLRSLADTVDAWGRGDLEATVRDAADDEIGQLARRLNLMAEQLRTLLETRQELAILKERQRLARDLHDAVKQQVFATAMQLAAAQAVVDNDPGAARDLIAAAEQLVHQTQQELTTLIRELRPSALTDKGLAAALADTVDDWSKRTKIGAEVRVQGERETPLAVEQALFRVAQEALANVARHSGATTVDVRLAWDPGGLTLAVADNGRGFDVKRVDGKGLGLSGMRERLEAIGGTLGVGSTSRGTRLEARITLQHPRPVAAGNRGENP